MSRNQSSVNKIKREQKKSLYLRVLSELFHDLIEHEPAAGEVYLSRVDLSADTGICYLYFAFYKDPEDNPEEAFRAIVSKLKFYKPSMRKALAQKVASRYTPDLLFLYDKKQTKVRNLNDLLDQVQKDLPEEDPQTDD